MTFVPLSRTASLAVRLPASVRRAAARLPGALAPPVEPGAATPRVAIIGTGFGGLGMAARLRQAGIETFTIYEKASAVGGTWRDNTYPGAACDVPSHLYSLSFAPKTDWSRRFPEQHEILAYLNDVADRFELRPRIRFDTEVTAATWDEGESAWRLTFADGTHDQVDVLVAATGQLNRPQIPAIEGLDGFAGANFHSARWDHRRDLTDRDVAVIGIGASAIQFVPEVAAVARSVTLFQRSSNFVAPKPDGEFSDAAKARFARWPWLRRLYRLSIWVRFDARFSMLRKGSRLAAFMGKTFEKKIQPLVSEELTVDALVPDYPIGCKRILISNNWYPTLLRPDVTVVTAPVERITAHGVVAGGEEHRADTIVFGTGFASTGFLAPMAVTGRGGADLHEQWADGAEAHHGITVAGFPNLFVMYGPNTNLGHNSIVFMLERQMSYILSCVRRMHEDRLGTLEVRADAQARSNVVLRRRLADTVWAASCHSWYKTEAGKITNNWSGRTVAYWRATAVPRSGDFTASRAHGPHASSPVDVAVPVGSGALGDPG